MQATEQLVRKQAEVWAESLAGAEARAAARLGAAIESALDKTAKVHAERLAELEKKTTEQSGKLLAHLGSLAAAVRETGMNQQEGVARVAEGIREQAQALVALQHNERMLIRLQETLQQNLAALNGAGAFEQAVHTLTAAVHLLTGRVAPPATVPMQAAVLARTVQGKAA
jgi:hypothetical protein